MSESSSLPFGAQPERPSTASAPAEAAPIRKLRREKPFSAVFSSPALFMMSMILSFSLEVQQQGAPYAPPAVPRTAQMG